MIRAPALAGLLLLAACNGNQAALTPDADAETRNATAAKTLADIAAAEAAASAPLPSAARPRAVTQVPGPPPEIEAEPAGDPDANEAAAPPQ